MSKKSGLVHHIEIYVSNLKKSTVFWQTFLLSLGYSKYQEWPEGISWKLEFTYIVFVQTKQKYLDIPYHRCRTGLNHLAFHAISKEQFDEIAKLLTYKGITLLYGDKYRNNADPGIYAIYFEDPDRIKIELVYSKDN